MPDWPGAYLRVFAALPWPRIRSFECRGAERQHTCVRQLRWHCSKSGVRCVQNHGDADCVVDASVQPYIRANSSTDIGANSSTYICANIRANSSTYIRANTRANASANIRANSSTYICANTRANASANANANASANASAKGRLLTVGMPA